MFLILRSTAGRICVALAICAGSAIAFLLSAGSATADTPGAPVITLQPVNATGYVDGTVQFTAAASGSPTPTVGWEYSTDNGATWNWGGQYTDTYTLGSLQPSENGDLVRADFTNSYGTTITSTAMLTVLPAQGVATPIPSALSFETVQVGSAAPEETVTVTNTGTRTLGFGAGYDNSDSYYITGDTCSDQALAPGASCSVTMLFVPSHEGAIDGDLVLPDNATPTGAPSQLLVDLLGYGGEPATLGANATNDGVVGAAVVYPLSVGGDPAPTVSISSGALPPGLVLNANNTISGTPTAAGTYQATLQANDGVGSPASATMSFTIASRVGLTLAPASVLEGNRGRTLMNFTYTLARPSTIATSFSFATKNGTATAGSDYVRTSGTVTIPAGVRTGQIGVEIRGDTVVEPDEQFTVRLSQPVGLVLRTRSAVGTILNDD